MGKKSRRKRTGGGGGGGSAAQTHRNRNATGQSAGAPLTAATMMEAMLSGGTGGAGQQPSLSSLLGLDEIKTDAARSIMSGATASGSGGGNRKGYASGMLGRPSLVFSLNDSLGPVEFFNNAAATAAANRPPKNVHGDREFIVKLQPPFGFGLTKAPWMCYDAKRSFQAFIHSNTDGLKDIYQILQSDGDYKPLNDLSKKGFPGYKGYFMAKWEEEHGRNIRIFYDRIMPVQNW